MQANAVAATIDCTDKEMHKRTKNEIFYHRSNKKVLKVIGSLFSCIYFFRCECDCVKATAIRHPVAAAVRAQQTIKIIVFNPKRIQWRCKTKKNNNMKLCDVETKINAGKGNACGPNEIGADDPVQLNESIIGH